MYAWYKYCRYMQWAAEAKLLFLLRDWSILGGNLLLTPGIWLVNFFVVPIAWRLPPLVFGVELVGLLEDPTTSVGMIFRGL